MKEQLSRGERLRVAIEGALELDEHEQVLLTEAERLCDRLDLLDAAIRRDGVLPDRRAHPALVEARQQAIVLARVLAALRLPADLSNPDERPQRRHGVRGVYTNVRHKLQVVD